MKTLTQTAPKLFISSLLAVALTVLLAHSVSQASVPAQARAPALAHVHSCATLAG